MLINLIEKDLAFSFSPYLISERKIEKDKEKKNDVRDMGYVRWFIKSGLFQFSGARLSMA
jgi:hypothetical protein